MTALNVAISERAVTVSTDGAGTGLDGTLATLLHKQVLLPASRAVIAVQGAGFLIPALAARFFVSAPADVESVRDIVTKVAGDAWAKLAQVAVMGDRMNAILVAGWSPRSGQAEAWISFTEPFAGREAWTWRSVRDWGHSFSSPPLPDELEWDGTSDATAWSRATMGHQREMLFAYPGQTSSSGSVGGFCQATTVTERGVASEILERWPDRLGEPIRP
jgi:hypothetical protein